MFLLPSGRELMEDHIERLRSFASKISDSGFLVTRLQRGGPRRLSHISPNNPVGGSGIEVFEFEFGAIA